MEETEFDETLKKLGEQVSQFSTPANNLIPKSGMNFISTFNIKSPIVYYGAIPIVIAVILCVMKPGFIMNDVDEDGNTSKKFNYKRLMVSVISFTMIVAILIFIYFYKMKIIDKNFIYNRNR